MIVIGQIARVLVAFDAHAAILLVRVADKTLQRRASSADDGDEYATLRPYIVVRDANVVPAYDCRLEYVLDVARDHEQQPTLLHGAEAELQQKGTRLAADARGEALPYRATAVIDATLRPTQLTYRVVRATLNLATSRNSAAATTPIASYNDMLRFAADANMSGARRRALLVTFSLLSLPYMHTSVVAGVRPASLAALSSRDLAAVHDVLTRLPPMPLAASLMAAWLDAVPLRLVSCRRALELTPAAHAQLVARMPEAEHLVRLVRRARWTRSTRGYVSAFADVPPSLAALAMWPAFEHVSTSDDGHGLFALARDAELERECARLVRGVATLRLMHAAGDASVYASIMDRLEALSLVSATAPPPLLVAPTPELAGMLAPVPLSAIDDIVGGRVTRANFSATTLVLVYAHRFGADSFVHVVRAWFPDPASLSAATLVLIGDVYDTDGSPRAGDRGMVLRDVATAVRHGHVPAIVDAVFGLRSVGPMHALAADDYDALRHRLAPALPHPTITDAYSVHASLDDSDATRTCLVVIAGAPQRIADLARPRYVAVAALGSVARVVAEYELVKPVHDGDALDVKKHCESFDGARAPLHTPGLVLELETTAVCHSSCCFTTCANVMLVAAHADCRDACGMPVRELAAIASSAIVDTLAVVLTDRAGVEDVRAAFTLARKHVLFIESGDSLDAAMSRHSARAQTGLVDMLAAPPADIMPVAFPPATPDAPETAPVTVHVVGSMSFVALVEHSFATLPSRERVVPLAAAATHLATFIEPRAATAPTDGVFDAVRARDGTALRHISASGIESMMLTRLAALLDPHSDEARTPWTRDEEAALIHVFSMVTKNISAAEHWFLSAERRLFLARHANCVDTAMQHVTAIREYLTSMLPLPTTFTEDDPESVYEKLRSIQRIIVDRCAH